MNTGEKSGSEGWRQGLLALLPVLLGTLVAIGLLQLLGGGSSTDFEDAALGKETTSYYSSQDGHPIHCKGLLDAEACLAGFRARGRSGAALLLGNSQLHAVNQFRESQENAPPILFRRLQRHDVDLLTFSQPNANLQEHYVLFEYLRGRLPLRTVTLAVVFDDLRETGLRADIAAALRDPGTVERLEANPHGRDLIALYREDALAEAGLGGVRETLQEHSERALDGWLSRNVPLWGARAEARGNLFLTLHRVRNTALGITPQSKRKMIPGRYDANMAALRALLEVAGRAGIDVLVYVAPLRDDLAVPYVQAEYAAFKKDLQRMVGDHGGAFFNLEALVPPDLWGAKDTMSVGGEAEIDFMHFQAEGHRLLAEELGKILEARLPAP